MKYAYVSIITVCLVSAGCWGAEQEQQQKPFKNEVVSRTNDKVTTGDGTVYNYVEHGEWKDKDGKLFFKTEPDDDEPRSYMISKTELEEFGLTETAD